MGLSGTPSLRGEGAVDHGVPTPSLVERFADSRAWRSLRRATVGRLPFPVLRSDVRDVVYATWLVSIERVQALIPKGVGIAERHGRTPLTMLAYRHGHFGPRLFGPMRRLFPSPLQSNWRLYVDRLGGAPPKRPMVLFVRNLFDSPLYAAGARLFSDALPSRRAATFNLNVAQPAFSLTVGARGSGKLSLAGIQADAAIPPPFEAWFGEGQALRSICLQDAAVVATPDGRLAEADIALPIDLAAIEPLAVDTYRPDDLLIGLGASEAPWCFLVPRVRFEVLGERLLPAGASAP